MKFLYTLITILFICSGAKAQDLIVTTQSDSIRCKIAKVHSERIQYWIRDKDKLKKLEIPTADVKSYVKDFYASKGQSPAGTAKGSIKYPKFTISPYGGLSYLLAKTNPQIPASLRDYISELKTGYHFGADATIFVSREWGFGLKYSNFKTSNETMVTGSSGSGKLRDDVTTQFIGPAATSRRISRNQRTVFNSGLSLGYLGYKNKAIVIDPFELSGSTVGMGFDFGIESKLSKALGLEFKIGFMAGVLSELRKSQGSSVQTITLEEEQKENLSRLDISVGLKWHK